MSGQVGRSGRFRASPDGRPRFCPAMPPKKAPHGPTEGTNCETEETAMLNYS